MNIQNIKQLNKFQILGASLLTLGLLGAGATIVKAAESTSYPPIVEKVSERFGLNVDEVGSFFEEEHATKKAEIKEQHEKHLSQLVEQGTITQVQKDALDAKHEEMDAFFEEIGLDPSVIRFEGRGMGEHQMGGRGHFGPRE